MWVFFLFSFSLISFFFPFTFYFHLRQLIFIFVVFLSFIGVLIIITTLYHFYSGQRTNWFVLALNLLRKNRVHIPRWDHSQCQPKLMWLPHQTSRLKFWSSLAPHDPWTRWSFVQDVPMGLSCARESRFMSAVSRNQCDDFVADCSTCKTLSLAW